LVLIVSLVAGAVFVAQQGDRGSDASRADGFPALSPGGVSVESPAPPAGGTSGGAGSAVGAMDASFGSSGEVAIEESVPAASESGGEAVTAGSSGRTSGASSSTVLAELLGTDMAHWNGVPDPPAPAGFVSLRASTTPVEPVLPSGRGGMLRSGDIGPVVVDRVEPGSVFVELLTDAGTVARGESTGNGLAVSAELRSSDPVSVSASVSPGLELTVLDDAAVRAVGGQKIAFTVGVSGLDPAALAPGLSTSETIRVRESSSVDLRIPYGDFEDEFGADWGGRLRLLRMEPCALDPEAGSECPAAQVVEGVSNDRDAGVLSVSVPLESLATPASGESARVESSSSETAAVSAFETQTVFALMAGSSSVTGDYGVTSLNPSGSWAVGEQSGSFSWTYPISAPAPPAGAAPAVSVSYNSGAIDGLTSDQNTQGGVLGPGWALSEGFIERSFKSCTADGGTIADFCWSNELLTFSFQGMNEPLVMVGDDPASQAGWRQQTFRMEHHTGWALWRFLIDGDYSQGSLGVDNNREYWVALAPDGTKYWFGYGAESGEFSPGTSLASVQTVPVVANHAGEPCRAYSWNRCHQAYRWSLDRVEDSNGRVTTFRYHQEINYYGASGMPASPMPYVRSASVVIIEYGQLVPSAVTADWHTHQVSFWLQQRCSNPNGQGVCQLAPTAATAGNFPDVPVDMMCDGTTSCYNSAPTFFSTLALLAVSTYVRNDSGTLVGVTNDNFFTEWADADGGGPESPRLWLRKIQHVGLSGGGTIYMPAIQFNSNQALANLVASNPSAGVTPVYFYRLTHILDEYGAEIRVSYYLPKPCTSAIPNGAWSANNWSCFPRWWAPSGGPAGFTAWNKYVVNDVKVVDQSGTEQATTMEWDYQYPDVSSTSGGVAWHSDRNPLVPVSARSWGEYRGFERVIVIAGGVTSNGRVATETIFHQGMNGDINSHNTGTTVPPDSETTPSNYIGAVADENHLAGRVRSRSTRPVNTAGTIGSDELSWVGYDYVTYQVVGYLYGPGTLTTNQVDVSVQRTVSSYGGQDCAPTSPISTTTSGGPIDCLE